MPDPTRRDLSDAFARHARDIPSQAGEAALFSAFLASADDVFERHHPPGHFTGSAWLVSGDGRRVLLTHHRKLGRWLQLGGHADGDPDLVDVGDYDRHVSSPTARWLVAR